MAEGLTRHYLGEYFDVFSAGTKPKGIDARAVKVMAEIGIDIAAQNSKSVDELISGDFDLVLTLCDEAKESCPVFPGNTEIVHLGFKDPADAVGGDDEILKVFRKIRDEIQDRLIGYLKEKYFLDQER